MPGLAAADATDPSDLELDPTGTDDAIEGQASVSIIVPARRWDERLEAALASIDRSSKDAGVRPDATVALAEQGPAEVADGITVVANPSGTIPDGLNLAIAASSGDIVIRVDSRCDLPRNYVAAVVAHLDDPTIGAVGGAQLVLDRGLFGSTYAIAFNSPLLGPSVYRYGRTSGPVSSPYLGAWRRVDLDELGGFDPRLLRNQDNELADRVHASGKAVWYDADLVVGYHNDRSLRGAVAHHHEFGLWRMLQRSHGQRALTARHATALAGGVVSVVAAAALLPSRRTRRFATAAGVIGYAVAGVAAQRSATRLRRARPDIAGPPFHPLSPVLAPALATVLDAAWAAGLVRGAIRSRRPPTTVA